MAYGSASALLAILDGLRAKATVLGGGVSGELLRGEQVVAEVIAADAKDPEAVRWAVSPADYDAVLVVSNRTNLPFYFEVALPVHFVDILYWYGDRGDHSVESKAATYFIEAFPGVHQLVGALPSDVPRPTVVGPLVRGGGAPLPGGTLVNLGGGQNRWILPSRDVAYAKLVTATLAKLRTDLSDEELVVAAGADMVDALAGSGATSLPGIRVGTLPQPDMMRRLAGCKVFITAPGLNAVFEALELDIPLLFLPPQNASQVEQLAIYEQHGLVAGGLNLPDLDSRVPAPGTGVPEEEMTRAVVASLARVAASPAHLARVVEHLREQLRTVHKRANARRAFRESLGQRGGQIVANGLNRWWRAHGGSLEV